MWEIFQQGAHELTGKPIVMCLLCKLVFSHTGLGGTSSAKNHLTRKDHLSNGRRLIYGNTDETNPIPSHADIVAAYKKCNGVEGAGSIGHKVSLFL
jgi:hypothetical protein